MGKKKKKKEVSILAGVDNTLDNTYEGIKSEIEGYQYQIYLAESEARKKVRKKLKKDQSRHRNIRQDGQDHHGFCRRAR